MGFDFKKLLGTALPILGAATGNPLLAIGGGAAGGALNGGGWQGALQGGAMGGLGSLAFGKGANPLKSLFTGGTQNVFQKQVVPGSPFSGVTSSGPGFSVNSIMKQESANKGFSGLLKNPLALGLGTIFGSQLIKSPKVPELPQSVIDFQNAARGGNPLQNQASQALMQQLQQTQQDLGQDEIDAINRQYDLSMQDELKGIDSMYKSLRPGTDPLTDSSYQKDIGRVRDRYATLRADSLANAQRQISNDFSNQRATQIAQANGLSQQQLQQLATLGQYDLDRQLSQLNIDYEDRQTLRNYLLQMGGNLAYGALQPQNPLFQLLSGLS